MAWNILHPINLQCAKEDKMKVGHRAMKLKLVVIVRYRSWKFLNTLILFWTTDKSICIIGIIALGK